MSGRENKCSESRGRSNHLESDLSHFPSNLAHQSWHPPTYSLGKLSQKMEIASLPTHNSRMMVPEMYTHRSQATPPQLLDPSQQDTEK